MSDSSAPQPKSSAREFAIIVLCALGLSLAFVFWLKTSTAWRTHGGLAVGEPAPPLVANEWVQGEAPSLDSLNGNVYVVVAWATWCVPCAREAPHLVDVHDRFAGQGVRFFGLTAASEQNRELILDWLKERGIPWPNGFGSQAVSTLNAFDAQVIPSVWVIGRSGKVVWNRSHEAEESLEEAIVRALKQPITQASSASVNSSQTDVNSNRDLNATEANPTDANPDRSSEGAGSDGR